MTSDEIGYRLGALERIVAAQVRNADVMLATLKVLLARHGDLDWVTIKEAALLEEHLYGKGTVGSVRRRMAEGKYTLMTRQGERAGRISVQEILAVYREEYAPMKLTRAVREAARKER